MPARRPEHVYVLSAVSSQSDKFQHNLVGVVDKVTSGGPSPARELLAFWTPGLWLPCFGRCWSFFPASLLLPCAPPCSHCHKLSSVGSRGSDHLCQEAPFPTALTEAAPSPALNTWEAVRLGPSQLMEQRWNLNTGQNSPHISRPHLPTPASGHQALHGTPCPGTATSPVIRAAPPRTLL